MRTAPVLPAIVAAATLALVHGCTLPLAGLSPSGAGGSATTSATSAGGARETTAATTSGGGATTTGATTTSVTGSSTSSGAPECTVSSGCKPAESCSSFTCTGGKCVEAPINEGMTFPDPDGNCLKTVCVGGTLTIQNDDDDFTDDGDPCTVDGCSSGVATHVGGNNGDDCGQPGHHCFSGQCLDCADATQCPPGNNPCLVATCNAGTCDILNQGNGTVCANANPCKDAGECMDGACVQNNKGNGTICSLVGKCTTGSCCFLAVCGNGAVCCGIGESCNNGLQQCK